MTPATFNTADVDAFLVKIGAKKETSQERQQADIKAWEEWNASDRDPALVTPLFKRFQGFIESEARKMSNVEMPKNAIRSEFNNMFMTAIKTYKPDKGAALGTWIGNQLRGAGRYVRTYQNPGRIVEARHRHITDFQVARRDLEEQYGRPASGLELADKLSIPVKEVERLSRELSRKSLPMSGFEGEMFSRTPSKEAESLRMMMHELHGEEQVVMEHLLGANGKERLDPIAIAGKMGVSPAKVYRIKKRLVEKVRDYI